MQDREEIDVAIPIASPRMYVTRYVNDLDGKARTETVAREVAAAADEAGENHQNRVYQ
jgi:transcription initiation factor TFIIIB Brf1 subunit/transcription initiation factor TFIIB